MAWGAHNVYEQKNFKGNPDVSSGNSVFPET